MNRKEAIARIQEHRLIHKNKEPRAIHISEALDMAIKALEQESILGKVRTEIVELDIYIMIMTIIRTTEMQCLSVMMYCIFLTNTRQKVRTRNERKMPNM